MIDIIDYRSDDISIMSSLVKRVDNLKLGDLKSYVRESFKHLFLGTLDGSIVFFTALTFEINEAEIDYLAIYKEYEHIGLASKFLSKVIEILKKEGVNKLLTECRSKNISAINFYKRNGFNNVRIRYAYYSNPIDDAILFEKNI